MRVSRVLRGMARRPQAEAVLESAWVKCTSRRFSEPSKMGFGRTFTAVGEAIALKSSRGQQDGNERGSRIQEGCQLGSRLHCRPSARCKQCTNVIVRVAHAASAIRKIAHSDRNLRNEDKARATTMEYRALGARSRCSCGWVLTRAALIRASWGQSGNAQQRPSRQRRQSMLVNINGFQTDVENTAVWAEVTCFVFTTDENCMALVKRAGTNIRVSNQRARSN